MRLLRIAASVGVLTLLLAVPASAGIVTDTSITKTDSPDPVTPGGTITYTITVANLSGFPVDNVSMSDTTPAGTTFLGIGTSSSGWSLTAPPVGGTGAVTATNPQLAASTSAVFTLTVVVDASVPAGSIISNTATVSTSSFDGNTANNSSTATTGVVAAAASVPDAAMPAPSPINPLVILGFGALLIGALTGPAVLAVRRSRT